MKLFGLTPEQIRQSSETSDLGPTKSLTASMLYGTLSFAIVSTLAYSLWAFRLVRGEALLFTAIAVVYLGLSGLALGRLLSIPTYFSLHCPVRPVLPALRNCLVLWFGLGGQYHGDLYGSAAGLLAAWFFHRASVTKACCIVLHSLRVSHAWLCVARYVMPRSAESRSTLMGACHGLGFEFAWASSIVANRSYWLISGRY